MQQGFRTGQSCIDAAFIVKQKHKKLYNLINWQYMFVDLETAFGNLNFWDTLNILLDAKLLT